MWLVRIGMNILGSAGTPRDGISRHFVWGIQSEFISSNLYVLSADDCRYVSAIHIPTFAPETLLSGGGDGTLKEWEWMTGKMIAELDISTSIHDFIKIKGGRKKWWEKDISQKDNEEEDEDEDGGGERVDEDKENERYPKPQETIQVLHKIDSFESGAKRWIVFSAIGSVSSLLCYLKLIEK